jgi:hypothetical protein
MSDENFHVFGIQNKLCNKEEASDQNNVVFDVYNKKDYVCFLDQEAFFYLNIFGFNCDSLVLLPNVTDYRWLRGRIIDGYGTSKDYRWLISLKIRTPQFAKLLGRDEARRRQDIWSLFQAFRFREQTQFLSL